MVVTMVLGVVMCVRLYVCVRACVDARVFQGLCIVSQTLKESWITKLEWSIADVRILRKRVPFVW